MPLIELELLTTRRFFPLFIAQFFGLFNDNLFKYSLILFITFSFVQNTQQAQLLINLIGGLYGIAYLLFSITIGQIADKYNRRRIIIVMKIAEIIILFCGLVSIYVENILLSLIVVFALGLHSAFIGPIKFSLLPDLLSEDKLLAGNSLILAGSVTAILVGSVLGLALGGNIEHFYLICILALLGAFIGCAMSFFIPSVIPLDPNLTINITNAWKDLRMILQDKKLFFLMFGISWGIFIIVIFTRQFPIYAKLFISHQPISVLMLFGPLALGAIIGALICHRVFKEKIKTQYTPLALLFISGFIIDICLTTRNISLPLQFNVQSARIFCDIFLIAFATSMYLIPLYAKLQVVSPIQKRSRVQGCSNLLISLFAVFAAIVAILLVRLQMDVIGIYIV